MTAIVLTPDERPPPSAADRGPLLRWLIFTGATIFAAALLWRYGLAKLMFDSDRTYISTVIAALYVGASVHCLWRTVVISREADAGRRTARLVVGGADLTRRRLERPAARHGFRPYPRSGAQSPHARAADGSTKPCSCARSPTSCVDRTASAASRATR